jgi:hypothetical protein
MSAATRKTSDALIVRQLLIIEQQEAKLRKLQDLIDLMSSEVEGYYTNPHAYAPVSMFKLSGILVQARFVCDKKVIK